MPTAKDMLRDQLAGRLRPVVVPFHTRWQEMPESEQHFSEEAIAHAVAVFRGDRKRTRLGRISASALGGCPRAALFTCYGAPTQGFSMESSEMMRHGTGDHLFWQMEGITMGWIRDKSHAEHFVMDTEYPVGGSLDAILFDDSVFELKTAGYAVYSQVVGRDRKPKPEHLLQAGCYMRMIEADFSSIVYEQRSTGAYHEFRIERDDALEAKVVSHMDALSAHVHAETLPPVYEDCSRRRGSLYKGCPYRDHCLTVDQYNRPRVVI